MIPHNNAILNEDLMAMWNLIASDSIKSTSLKKIRVSSGLQVSPFTGAWYRSNLTTKNWTVEYICLKNVNENRMTPASLVDWLHVLK
jgi:hypothetical protein